MEINKKNLTRIKLVSILVLGLFAISLILSQKANPDNLILFPLKRTQENVYLNLKNNPKDKLDYMSTLLDRRLEELDSMVRTKSYCCILNASLRYSTLAGQITENIEVNNMKDIIPSLVSKFQNHKKVLQDIYEIYPKNTENMEYKYIEDDLNYLDLYIDKLSKI